MHKFSALAAIVLGMTLAVAAQEVPQVEIFGGYSMFHFDQQDANSLAIAAGVPAGSFTINENLHGWEGAVQFNINKWLGAVADVSGHYGVPFEATGGSVDGNTHNFLFGPQINFRAKKVKIFGHALFGVNYIHVNANPPLLPAEFSDNAFGMALGGGIDLNVGNWFALRAGQLDYLFTDHNFGMGHQNPFRFSAGFVFNLGRK